MDLTAEPSNPAEPCSIEILEPESYETALPALARLLADCVQAGAAVNFILPFDEADARDFWQRKVTPGVRAGLRDVFVARMRGQGGEGGDGQGGDRQGRIAGTVQLDCEMMPNQVHRGEVTKLLVHPDFRRRGIGRALMRALIEQAIHGRRRRLLTLDTRSGDDALPLYRQMGFEIAGEIPNFSRHPFEETLEATTYMYRILD